MSYQSDLAYIHDLNNAFARESVAGIVQLLFEQGVVGGHVVDVGCGTGMLARQLVDSGLQLTCSDYSASFLKIARRRVPEATFQHASLVDYQIPPCDAVMAIGEVINYRFDKRAGRRALRSFFRRVYDALPSGGVFLTDFAKTGRDRNRPKTHWLGDEYGLCVEFSTDELRNRLTREITTFRLVGKNYRRGREVHELQLYETAEVVSHLREIGFRVRTHRAYGDFPLPKNMVGVIAKK